MDRGGRGNYCSDNHIEVYIDEMIVQRSPVLSLCTIPLGGYEWIQGE